MLPPHSLWGRYFVNFEVLYRYKAVVHVSLIGRDWTYGFIVRWKTPR